MIVEKYGVVEEFVKAGESGKENTCPICGLKLQDRDETGILICPVCGTKPFEETDATPSSQG